MERQLDGLLLLFFSAGIICLILLVPSVDCFQWEFWSCFFPFPRPQNQMRRNRGFQHRWSEETERAPTDRFQNCKAQTAATDDNNNGII